MGVGLGQGKKAEPRLGRRWRQLTIAAASLDNDFGAKLGRGRRQLAPVYMRVPFATVPFHQCLCTLCTTRTPTPPANRARLRCLSRRHGVSRCTVCQCVEAARRPSCACSRARVLQMTRCHGRRGAGNAAMAEAAAMAQAAAVARRMKTMAQAFAQGPLVTLAAARRGSADGRTLLKSGISTPNRASREPKERCLTRPATPAAPSAWPSAAPGATPPGATPGATPGVPPAMPPAQHEIHECA